MYWFFTTLHLTPGFIIHMGSLMRSIFQALSLGVVYIRILIITITPILMLHALDIVNSCRWDDRT